jgi:Flp pilus assembly protein TadG
MVRRLIASTRGDTATELALIAPLLALILVGIMELGRVVDAWVIVHNAAREGARAGVVVDPPSNIGTVAQQVAATYLTTAVADRRDIASTAIEAPVVTADAVEVTASADVHIYAPLMRQILSARVPVRANASMRRQ